MLFGVERSTQASLLGHERESEDIRSWPSGLTRRSHDGPTQPPRYLFVIRDGAVLYLLVYRVGAGRTLPSVPRGQKKAGGSAI